MMELSEELTDSLLDQKNILAAEEKEKKHRAVYAFDSYVRCEYISSPGLLQLNSDFTEVHVLLYII